MLTVSKFRVVQPYGRDKARECSLIDEADTAEEAFAVIDRLAFQMKRTGAPSDAIELIVVGPDGHIVNRRVN